MTRRIEKGIERSAAVEIVVDGQAISAHEGESLAAALMVAGLTTLRHSPRAGMPRGAFCMMGVCQECVVEIDGRTAQSCAEPVTAGMVVSLGPSQ